MEYICIRQLTELGKLPFLFGKQIRPTLECAMSQVERRKKICAVLSILYQLEVK